MFKPKNANSSGNGKREFDPSFKMPEPKAGSRPARISMIVDLGTQERPDFEDPKTKEIKTQAPAQQVIVYADLVNDVVDYGGSIGMQQYRLCLNKTFGGETQGVNFTAVPPRDAEGNMISGKPWGFHPMNLLTKLSKAVQKPEVIESMDIEELLGEAFMAQVEVRKTESKDKKDDEGNPVVYTNVNFKSAAEIPMIPDDDGNEAPMRVKPLAVEPMIISFDDAKPGQIKYLRKSVINMIKLAKNYSGSKMQEAVESFEASQNIHQGASEAQGEAKKEEPKQPVKEVAKKAAKKVPEPVEEEVEDEDIPF